MKEKKRDIIVMLLIMALSIVVLYVFIPSQIKIPARANNIFTNRTFPQFTVAVVFFASLCGFVKSAIEYHKERRKSSENGDKKPSDITAEILPLIGAAIVLGYAILFKTLSKIVPGYGFIIATIIFIPVFLMFLRCRKWQYYLATYCFSAGMYLIFRYILNVMLR